VVGSYERGDRAVSVQRLAELAAFYAVPVSDLLPPEDNPFAASGGGRSTPLNRVILNLEKLAGLADSSADILRRFTSSIQHQRGEVAPRMLTVRHDDLRLLALMYDTTSEALTERLLRWQVLAPDSVIVDGEP
jgi:transcriptional regulator with XRE-family HTH domain